MQRLLIGLALLLAGCSSDTSPVAAAKAAGLDSSACREFRTSIPQGWIQGTLTVPEDPDDSSSPKIHVFYYGILHPNSIPTIYFNGGPAEDSHGDFQALTDRKGMFDPGKRISLIFLDQRGNGCSDPYPQGHTPDILQRLQHYGTRGIVADAEAVRAAVWPGKKWIAAGQSYGGYIVHRYVTLHPEALAGAISEQDVLTMDGYERLKRRYAGQNMVMQDYLTEYPDDEARLENLRNTLTLDTCFESDDQTEKVCGFAVLQPLVMLIGFSDDWMSLHQWLGIMAPGNSVSQKGMAEYAKQNLSTDSDDSNDKSWANAVISFSDRALPVSGSEVCEQAHTDLLPAGIDLTKVLLNECMAVLQANPKTSSTPPAWTNSLKKDPLTIDDLKQVLQTSQLPFYLYSSAKDPFVPASEFTEEVAAIGQLPNVHYTEFMDSGHDASYNEPQTWADWVSLSTPTK